MNTLASRSHLQYLGTETIDSAISVHRALGPGLLESTYQACLKHELGRRSIPVETEVALPVEYQGARLDIGYRIDMLIDGAVVVENKAVHGILPVHEAQLLTYLKLTGLRLGYLINWNVPLLKNGLKRMVNGF